MKNLFTVDVDSNEEYGEYSSFILRKVDAELSERQNESFEELDEHQKKASLPFWLSIIKFSRKGVEPISLTEANFRIFLRAFSYKAIALSRKIANKSIENLLSVRCKQFTDINQ